jgi:formamidopyrimidine-DNA glycosylase
MPELPEVEAARALVERVAAGRRIVRAWCARDGLVFERASSERWRRALIGRRFLRARRHGKHLWLELDRRPWPCLHFGMTGNLHVPSQRAARLVSSGKRRSDDAWPPRFAKLWLTFEGGAEFVVSDARRLGRIRLRRDPRGEPPISLLGFDALLNVPSPSRFYALVHERAAPVKALLLDQSFAAGVGNWIADEVLYQARIAPARPARSLTAGEVRRLRTALRRVVRTAVGVGADSDRYPRGWLFHRRWGRRAGSVTAGGEQIRHDTIGGRTTAWVPRRQR